MEAHGADDATQPAWPLGPLAERILQVIWERGPSTVRQVLAVLQPERAVAYTTVMTVMNRLAERGLLHRVAAKTTYTYTPAYSEAEYGALVSQRLTRDLVARFGDLALAQFVAELERLDPEHLAQLRRLGNEGEST